MSPQVHVVLLNWNGKQDTLECLASLRADRYPRKQVIVVDNGSRDGSVSALRQAHPEVTVLETGANLGFTGGNNVGIRHAMDHGAEFIWVLNNDTVVEPDAIGALVEAADTADYGVLTPMIQYFDSPEQAWFAGSRLDLRSGSAVHDNHCIPDASEAIREIPWATGCAMFVRASLMQRLRGFDDRFFLNWEDVDLSMRARALGWKIGIAPGSRIYHKVSRSFTAQSCAGAYYHLRNNLLFLSLHAGSDRSTATRAVLALRTREALRAWRQGKPNTSARMRAMAWAVRDHHLQRYGYCAAV